MGYFNKQIIMKFLYSNNMKVKSLLRRQDQILLKILLQFLVKWRYVSEAFEEATVYWMLKKIFLLVSNLS